MYKQKNLKNKMKKIILFYLAAPTKNNKTCSIPYINSNNVETHFCTINYTSFAYDCQVNDDTFDECQAGNYYLFIYQC